RGGPVVLERDHRLRQEMHRTACRAPSRAQVEPGGELHERLEEGAVGGRRLPPPLLPDLLGFEVAAAVEEADAAADGGGDVERGVEAAGGRGHLRSTRGTAASISRAKCSAGRAAERSRSNSSSPGEEASLASSSSISRLERPRRASSSRLTRPGRASSPPSATLTTPRSASST